MPSTVNGIGTHYYGKKNIQKRTAACHSCGRTVELTSYDTRLWFVIVFIPIIPLGRKRILDYCSACTRHYAVEADKWETARQLEVSGAQDKFRTDPSPDNAIAVHQQMLQYHQLDQAADFQKTMTEKFPDSARIHAYLGAGMMHLGKSHEAKPFYARALELRPDLPEARIGVALSLIAEAEDAKLDEAHKLLDFLEKPGSSKLYELEPLNKLARAYQNNGRHHAALALYEFLLKELPHLGEQKWFRDAVARSENVKDKPSFLPKTKFSWKRFFSGQRTAGGPRITWRGMATVGCLLAVAFVIFLVSNEYIRRHRTLYLISDLKEPALVQVKGVGSIRVGKNPVTMSLKEGRYHASINGPLKQEVDFEITSGFWSRCFGNPAWVLNVGGSALLEVQTATYAKNPPPIRTSFHFGESFHHFDGVTHIFEALPSSVSVDAGSSRTLVGLNRFSHEPAYAFMYFDHQKNVSEAMRLAEWQLRKDPEDQMMLQVYVTGAKQHDVVGRAEKFLYAGLTNRPVAIQWHRLYQWLKNDAQHDAVLAAEYDRQLELEPTNSALMYLRGRVTSSRAESRTWFQRACAADTNNAFAFFACGYDQMSVGNFQEAFPLLSRACKLQPKQLQFEIAFIQTRLALGQFDAVEKTLRTEISAEPDNYLLNECLCDALIAAGKNPQAEQAIRAFETMAITRARDSKSTVVADIRSHWLYASGDFVGLEKQSLSPRNQKADYARYTALIELNRLDEATKIFPIDSKLTTDAFHYLNTAIAYRLAGNATEAGRWQEQAVAILLHGDADQARAGEVLRKTAPPTQAEVDDVSISIDDKASLLTALSQLHPAQRAEFATQARQLNISWAYPHHLLTRATAATP